MILKSIHYLYYALFFVTPLLMSSKTSEMFEFNKMMYIYLISVLASALWLVHYIVRRPKLYLPSYLYILLIFIGVYIASTVTSIDTHTSIFGYYGRWNGGLVSIIAYTALFFVFIQTFWYEKVMVLLKVTLAASVVVILWGLPGLFGSDISCLWFTGQLTNGCWTQEFQPAVRMFSTLGQPNWLGAYLAIHFCIGLFFFLKTFPLPAHMNLTALERFKHVLVRFHILHEQTRPFSRNLMYGAYVAINLIAISYTKSRSALLAIGIILALGIIFVITSSLQRRIKVLIRSVLIVIMVITALSIVYVGSNLMQVDTPEHLQITNSFEIRTIVWQGAIDLAKQYPLLGTGPETFAYAYYFARPIAHNQTSEWDFIYNKAHNEFLNYAATMGFVGLGSYLLLIVGAIYVFYRSHIRKNAHKTLLSFHLFLAFVTIVVTNFFGFSTSTIQLFFYCIPAIVLVLYADRKESSAFNEISDISVTGKIQIVVTGIIASVLLWQMGRYYQADRLYKQAKDQIYLEEYQSASQLLSNALKYRYEHVYEDTLSSTLAQLAFLTSFDSNSSESADLILLSKDFNAHALSQSPKNILYLRTQAKNHYFYYQSTRDSGDLQKAVNSMQQTVFLAPTDAQSYYMLALFYSLLATEVTDDIYTEKALQHLEYALELRPNYIEAQELLEELRIKD